MACRVELLSQHIQPSGLQVDLTASKKMSSASSSRKFFVGGNFKSNGTKSSLGAIFDRIRSNPFDASAVEVVVAPPALYLEYCLSTAPEGVAVSAQNCATHPSGAYTGEIGAPMLVDIGVPWVIVGHSERRNIYGETNEIVATKVAQALSTSLSVILCVGEKLDERQAGTTFDVVFAQMAAVKGSVSDWSRVVIAYEPVWAIGTGLTATPEQAQEVHAALRSWLSDHVSPTVAATTRIIYGGSVTGANAKSIGAMADVDGYLVGGASLKPEFDTIIRSGK